MKYLRAVIDSDIHGPVYRKDFDAEKVFAPFVTSFVRTLLNSGAIYDQEHYRALIIPRYGHYLRMPSTAMFKEPDEEYSLWISLKLEEAIRPDEPITYFALELFV